MQADSLQKLVTFLVGLSSFYAIVLGISSYLTAQHSIDRSKENADRVQELREELEKRFPLFHGFGRSMEQVVEQLTKLLPNADFRQKYYDGLSEQDKQQIAYYERSMALFVYLDLSASRETVRIYPLRIDAGTRKQQATSERPRVIEFPLLQLKRTQSE